MAIKCTKAAAVHAMDEDCFLLLPTLGCDCKPSSLGLIRVGILTEPQRLLRSIRDSNWWPAEYQ